MAFTMYAYCNTFAPGDHLEWSLLLAMETLFGFSGISEKSMSKMLSMLACMMYLLAALEVISSGNCLFKAL